MSRKKPGDSVLRLINSFSRPRTNPAKSLELRWPGYHVSKSQKILFLRVCDNGPNLLSVQSNESVPHTGNDVKRKPMAV